MTLPVLALHLDGPVPPGLRALVVAMSAHCRPIASHRAPGAVAAIVLGDARPPVPYALWSSRSAAPNNPARVLLYDEDVAMTGSTLRVPGQGSINGVAVSPAVRRRVRRARGLDPAAVLVASPGLLAWQDRAIDRSHLPSALGLAAAVAVTDPEVLLAALSWGAPVVTTAKLATDVGAVPGRDLLVSASPESAARDLALDDELAARLSSAARRFVTDRHDLAGAARQLAVLLGLHGHHQPLRLPYAVLDCLATPSDAFIRTRVTAALAPLEKPMLPEPLSPAQAAGLQPDASPPPVATAKRTARGLVKGLVTSAVRVGARSLAADLEATRRELARVHREVEDLRAATSTQSTAALSAEIELLRAEVQALRAP